MQQLTIRPNRANMGGSRLTSAIDMILVHCTEGDSARGAADWWARPVVMRGTEGSAHVVFDDEVMIRAVDDDQVAYGAFGYNGQGLHIEIAGHVAWTRAQWLSHMPRLRAAAAFQAAAHRRYGVPFVWSTTSGYHSHAGLPGNDHTDPGPAFPWDVYRPLVASSLRLTPESNVDALPGGMTLRLQLPGRHEVLAGWTACIAAMRAIARDGLKRDDVAISWQGSTWRGAHDVTGVVLHLLAQFHLDTGSATP